MLQWYLQNIKIATYSSKMNVNLWDCIKLEPKNIRNLFWTLVTHLRCETLFSGSYHPPVGSPVVNFSRVTTKCQAKESWKIIALRTFGRRTCFALREVFKLQSNFTLEDIQQALQHMVSDGKLINIPHKGLDSYYAVDINHKLSVMIPWL